MKAASPSSCPSAVPRLPFQPLASSVRKVSSAACNFIRRSRDVETNGAMLGQAVALAAQLFQFLGAERLVQQFVGVAGRVETGAHMGLQHARPHAVAPQHFRKGRIAAPSSDMSRRISAWAPACRACCSNARRGVLRRVAIERRRAKRAIGMRADQRGQRDPVGAPQRNHRQQPDQPGMKHRSRRQAQRHRCDRARKRSPPIPSPADNSRSARWRARLSARHRGAEMSASGDSRVDGPGRRCARLRGILDRCATDHRLVGNLSHFPRVPVSRSARGPGRIARFLHRVAARS